MSVTSQNPDPTNHYVGEAGRQYHEERSAWRGKEGQTSRAPFFHGLTDANDVVLDFGCGVGGVLAALPAKRRLGVEVNEIAAAEAAGKLDEVHQSTQAIASATVDRIISFHALEHVSNPYEVMREFHRILAPGGRLRVIVPYESVAVNAHHRSWRPEDRDMHLYAWTPLTFGNLLNSAGFKVGEVKLGPFSNGGKLAQLFSWSPTLRNAATWMKARRHGKFQVIAEAAKA